MVGKTQNEHVLHLSGELLEDIELDRLPSDKLLLKATRLARLSGSDETRVWLSYEMLGYNSQDPISRRYMSLTARWTDPEKNLGFYGPLAQQEQLIESYKTRLDATKINSVQGEWANRVMIDLRKDQNDTTAQLMRLSGIRSRVIALLHGFVSKTYYERQFADIAASTFDGYKLNVDAIIAEKAGLVLEKIPSVIERLREGDGEAISQALTTCRRILEAFADAVLPPSEGCFAIGENQLSLAASKFQNRINVYVAQRIDSETRRKRLRQNLSNLFDRVSTGVHSDVSADEAFSLFLNVYLFLGEVLSLPDPV